jgi:AcrR family transcriptional regulator
MHLEERRGRPRSREADQAILQAALRLLTEEGYPRMSIEAVARTANVGKPAIYRRYRDKADLAAAAIADIGGNMTSPVDTGDTRGDLVEFVRRVSEMLPQVGIPLLGTIFAERERHPELHARFRERVAEPRRALARELLARGMARGDVRRDVDVEVVVDHLIGAFFARHVTGPPLSSGWADQVVSVIWPGIASR